MKNIAIAVAIGICWKALIRENIAIEINAPESREGHENTAPVSRLRNSIATGIRNIACITVRQTVTSNGVTIPVSNFDSASPIGKSSVAATIATMP